MDTLEPSMISFWASADKIYGEIKYDLQSLVNLVKDFKKESLVEEICKLIDKVNEETMSLKGDPMLEYLNRSERKRLKHTCNYKKKFFIHKEQLFKALRIVLIFANGTDDLNDNNKHLLGELLLKINYLLQEQAENSGEVDETERLNNLIRELIPITFISNYRDVNNRFTKHSVSREYYRYVKYWEEHQKDKSFDLIQEDFKEISGVEMKDYFSLCFSLAFTIINKDERKIKINPKDFFSLTPLTEEVKYFKQRFILNIEEYCNQPTWKEKEETISEYLDSQFLPIISFPLCQFNDQEVFIIDKFLLGKKILEDPYWVLENYYLENKEKEKRRELSSAFGRVWQEYVKKQIHENISAELEELDDENANGKKADFILETEDSIAVIETKHFIFSLKTQAGDLNKFNEDISKIFGEQYGLVQIDQTIAERNLEENGKRIYRVLIIDELIPEVFPFFKYYETNFANYKSDNPKISQPIIITKDEFERIVTLDIEKLFQLFKIRNEILLSKRTNGHIEDISTQNILDTLLKNRSLAENQKDNPFSSSLYEEFGIYVKAYLFPREEDSN